MKSIKCFLMILLLIPVSVYSQTTGKVYGKVLDKITKKPITAVNVTLKETALGAATDYDGNYFLINIPPGEYLMEFKGIGYKKHSINKIVIRAGVSTELDIYLSRSNEYELTEQIENFYLGLISNEKKEYLSKLKEEDKLKYQRVLLETYFNDSQNNETVYDKIQKINKEIEIRVDEYKIAKMKKGGDEDYNVYMMKRIEKKLYKLLNERFELKESKMKKEFDELNKGLKKLKAELENFRNDKDKIIKGQFLELTK